MSKLLVTGATGNIGSNVVKKLKEKKISFTAGATTSGLEKLKKMGMEALALNYDNVLELTNTMKNFDVVFILAPLTEKMREWSINMINAAKKAGVKHIIRSSALGSDENSEYMLIKEHGLINKAVKESGINYTIIKPNTFMQNFLSFYADSIKNGGAIYLPNGEQKISYVDVRDVGDFAAEILSNPSKYLNKEYDLTGKPVKTQEIAEIFSKHLGKKIEYVSILIEAAEKAMNEMQIPGWIVKALTSLNEFGLAGKADFYASDLENVLGKQPVSFEAFVKENIEFWRIK